MMRVTEEQASRTKSCPMVRVHTSSNMVNG